MQVEEVMTSGVLTVPVDLRVSEALMLAHAANLHHLLLTDSRRLVGVACVCELEIRDRTEPLRHFVPKRMFIIEAESPVAHAARRFVDKRVGCFPVLHGTELVGVLTRGDLRRANLSERELPPGLRCSYCDGTRHVRPLVGQRDSVACLECARRDASDRRVGLG